MGRVSRFWIGLLAASVIFIQVTPVMADPVEPDFAGDSVMLVVDVSGSMSGTPLSQAKDALHATVASLDDAVAVGLRSYAGSCGNGGIRLVDVGLDNRAELDAAIDGLSAGGGTPTPDALRAAVADLPQDGQRSIVLVSDGASSCGPACAVASELVASETVDFTVFTVGFNAPASAAADLTCVADTTGGTYVPATDTETLIDAIGGAVGGAMDLRYVALGDSFSSGEGAGAGWYFQDDEGYDIKCHRAPTAWSFVLAEASSSINDDVENAACSGAKTQHVQDAWFHDEQAQVLRLLKLNAAEPVDLVTITIGGNDIGFSKIIRNCFLADCANELGKKGKKLSKLKDELVITYKMIASAAPGAEIVVVGYPRLLPDQHDETENCAWLESPERANLNTLTRQLNDVVKDAAGEASVLAGRQVSYIDVTDAFDGHELCTAHSEINPITGYKFNAEQAHPTQNGQRFYAAAVLEGLQELGITP